MVTERRERLPNSYELYSSGSYATFILIETVPKLQFLEQPQLLLPTPRPVTVGVCSRPAPLRVVVVKKTMNTEKRLVVRSLYY